MRILRAAAALAISHLASRLMPRPKTPDDQTDETEETEPYESLVRELDHLRNESRQVYGMAAVFVLLFLAIFGVLHLPKPYGPELFSADPNLELITWGITVLVVLVVAITFDRVRTLPPDLTPGATDHAELARRIHHSDGIHLLTIMSLAITAILIDIVLINMLFGTDRLTAFVALLILGLFGWCFCQYAISARVTSTLLENVEAWRDRHLEGVRRELHGTKPASTWRRVLFGLALGTVAILMCGLVLNYRVAEGIPFKLLGPGALAALATCLPLPLLIAGGLAADAENKLKRLRIYGADTNAKQSWPLRYRWSIGCSILALAGPVLVTGSLIWAGWHDPRVRIMVAAVVVSWGLSAAPIIHGARRIYQGAQLRYIEKRDKQRQTAGTREVPGESPAAAVGTP